MIGSKSIKGLQLRAIWKLYGTVSRKGDDVPERPHRFARVLEAL